MDLGSGIYRLDQWTRQFPRWARPPLYGALFIVALIGLRGGLVAMPLLIAGIIFTSDQPGRDLAMALAALALAIVGGALSGVTYAFSERWVRPIPGVGRALGGMLIVAPYVLVVSAIVHVVESPKWNSPITDADVFAFCLCTVLFGLVFATDG